MEVQEVNMEVQEVNMEVQEESVHLLLGCYQVTLKYIVPHAQVIQITPNISIFQYNLN